MDIRQRFTAQDHAAQASAVSPEEAAELERRRVEAERIFATGREVQARVLSNSVNGRTLAGIPLINIRLELLEDPPRKVGHEYCWGRRGAAAYPVGKVVPVRIDPNDPEAITPAK